MVILNIEGSGSSYVCVLVDLDEKLKFLDLSVALLDLLLLRLDLSLGLGELLLSSLGRRLERDDYNFASVSAPAFRGTGGTFWQ